jgi:hypothetical protein
MAAHRVDERAVHVNQRSPGLPRLQAMPLAIVLNSRYNIIILHILCFTIDFQPQKYTFQPKLASKLWANPQIFLKKEKIVRIKFGESKKDF